MTASASDRAYQLLFDKAGRDNVSLVSRLTIGLTWTACSLESTVAEGTVTNLGLAMTLGPTSRTLPWSGTLAGQPVKALAQWLDSWNTIEAAVGLATVNSTINGFSNQLLAQATRLTPGQHPNLAVFEHFKPQLMGEKVVVIGHYPGISDCLSDLDVCILERSPSPTDLPDTAAEYLIPKADWVFITASSLINKTFPRLATLAENANTVMMGPSTPWLQEWEDFGINYLAGVVIANPEKTQQIAAEGGGVRLFEEGGVDYALAKIGD